MNLTAASDPGVGFVVRQAVKSDAAQLLVLMQGLARFEGYIDHFRVAEHDLVARGLGHDSLRQFDAFVAESNLGELWGYALTYEIAYTFDLRPTLVLKELFVAESARGQRIGRALMRRVLDDARNRKCGRVKWDVLPANEGAKSFYRTFGARPERDWEPWALSLA